MSDYPPPPNPPGGYEQQPGYPPPGGGYPPPPAAYGAPKNGMGTAALVLGIVSVIPCAFAFGAGVLVAIPAIILGFVARGKAKRGEATNGGVALAGVILGIIGVLASLGWGAFYIWAADDISNYGECIDDADDDGSLSDQEQEDCLDEF